ncbi:MAG: type IX secretion system protein PorQ [Bacteroidia bacterium]|nr:type IX secretion system protein PorQ [Bacteroidia bacterium]
MKKLWFLFLLATCRFFSQGGLYNFQLLNVPENALQAAMGGNNFLLLRDIILYSGSSEATISEKMHGQLGVFFGDYVTNLHFFGLKYAYNFENIGTTSYGFRFFNYGKFKGYDEFGNSTGSFFANDFLFHAGISRNLPEDTNFRLGIRCNAVYSKYHDVWAIALTANIGAHYRINALTDISVNALNVGAVLKDYYQNNVPSSRLPSDVVVSFGHKLKKAPIRFLWNYHQLLKWKQRYQSPLDTGTKTLTFSNEKKQDTSKFRKIMIGAGSVFENFLRHIVLGLEFDFSKNFKFYLGFNYKRQQEMMLLERRGMNWLSFGFLINTKRFTFSYSYNQMGFAGRSNQLGISMPLWFRRKDNS